MNIKQRRNMTAPDQFGRQQKILDRLAVDPKKVYLDFTQLHSIHEQNMYLKVKNKLLHRGTLGNQLRDTKKASHESKETDRKKHIRAKTIRAPRVITISPEFPYQKKPKPASQTQQKLSHQRTRSLPKVNQDRIRMQMLPPRMLLHNKRVRSMDMTPPASRSPNKTLNPFLHKHT